MGRSLSDEAIRALIDDRTSNVLMGVHEAFKRHKRLEERVVALQREVADLQVAMPDPPSRAEQLLARIAERDPLPGSLLFDIQTYLREQEADR